MIVRIKFEAVVVDKEAKSKMLDYIDIHSPVEDLSWAKIVFAEWISKNAGIRGSSAFHPLGKYGDIKFKSAQLVEEKKEKK